jgi:RNA polymerase sigma factor (sigma-70 family)
MGLDTYTGARPGLFRTRRGPRVAGIRESACGYKRTEAGDGLTGEAKRRRFERAILPHLDAAYDFARWLTRDGVAAEEVVQEAYLRAFRYFDSFHGDNGRAWLLSIVRNTCFSLMDREPPAGTFEEFDESLHFESVGWDLGPEGAAMAHEARALVHDALAALPEEFRETIVLRELHDLSYREIASATDAPIGTVMSRLARGRALLAKALAGRLKRKE